MIRKILNYIDEYNMLDNCNNIVVGLSGGADSVCLINALAEIVRLHADKYGSISITAVHINHGIRGEEAERDEAFAKSVADNLGIKFMVYRLDIPGMAKQRGISEETAGRIARYECFRKTAAQLDTVHTRIAVAHHMDDQAETVLMHMIRGSSVDGLAGMRPVAGDIIRPLLCVSRTDIEKYLGGRAISFVTDSTNMDNGYTRNMVRNCIIPDIEKINPQFKQAVNNMSDDVAEYLDYIAYMTDKAEKMYVHYNERDVVIGAESVGDDYSGLIVRNLIKKAYSYIHGDIVNLYRVHIEDAFKLFGMENGKSINLPAGVIARKVPDGVMICEAGVMEHTSDRDDFEIGLDVMGKHAGEIVLPYCVHYGKSKVEWEVIENKDLIKLNDNDYTKYFDYDMIKCNPVFRYRKAGDRCIIDVDGHARKLKQELIDRKIPSERRKDILMLAAGSDVVWAVGVRRYQQFLVTDETQKVLRISVY